MDLLRRASIEGLFGYMNHSLDINPSAPTIVTGLNGTGKTHTLKIVALVAGKSFEPLFELPFETASLTFTNGTHIEVRRQQVDDDVTLMVELAGAQEPRRSWELHREDLELRVPPWMHRTPEGDFVDERSGVVHSRSQAAKIPVVRRVPQNLKLDEIEEAWPNISVAFVDTKRLHALTLVGKDRHVVAGRPFEGRQSRVQNYLSSVRRALADARREAIAESQLGDTTFAERALAVAGKAVNQVDLEDRYNTVVAQHNRLEKNGLAVGGKPLDFPDGKLTPTVKRILDLFVDDWEKRLKPLLPLNEKIELFRGIMDSKLEPSFKRTEISARTGVVFVDNTGRRISVESLSSGEQHLIALYTKLIFDTTDGTVVLVDEPEISLHPAWQHSFIEDIESIGESVRLQAIIATHSPSIINGRWELEQALAMQQPPVDNALVPDRVSELEDEVDD